MDRTADFPRERDFRPGGSAGGPQQSNTNATARGQSKIINHFMDFNGGRTRARTLDPLIKSQLLYQLSYAPIEIAGGVAPS